MSGCGAVVSCECGRKAVYIGREPLCREHFDDWLRREVHGELDRFVGREERLAVAVSGGKDSTTLLDLAHAWARDNGVQLFALCVDEGIGGYRDATLDFLRGFCRERGIDLRVRSFQDAVGDTLDGLLGERDRLGKEWGACSICGTLRRYLINRAAREAGATKVLFAHNRDDELQTLLMNLFTGNVAQLSRKGELAGAVDHPLFVRRFKPLIDVPEKATATYAFMHYPGMPQVECPYLGESARTWCRRVANRWEFESPGAKRKVMGTYLEKILPELRERAGDFHPELVRCSECGEPTSQEVCNACLMRNELVRKP